MGIERKTTTLGLDILQKGTRGWGVTTNNNMDLIDAGFASDRTRIDQLETTSATLPIAIANRVGHNLLKNNIFSQAIITNDAAPTYWDIQFLNGATGIYTRTSQTYLVGTHSLRIDINNVNTSPSYQTRPYPGLNILDPQTDFPIATTDTRQLTNGFGYAFQTVNLSPKTIYTLSGYGKAEIPNTVLVRNSQWKVGIVFKNTIGEVIHSYFTTPQTNSTTSQIPSSFQRTELTFTTPDLPVVTGEVWLVNEGVTPAAVGTVWFDGIQLEQASKATALDTFSLIGSDMYLSGNLTLGGNLTLQQPILTFESAKVIFSGDVQIGDNISQDNLDVFTRSAIFHGPLTVNGNVELGDDANTDIVTVAALQTTFKNNQSPLSPTGGNVTIEGNLIVQGNTTLGNSSANDTVTINAKLVTAGNDFEILNDLKIRGDLQVDRAVTIGTNSSLDKFTVQMADLGSEFEGDVTLNDDLVVKGNTYLGDQSTDTVTIQAGLTSAVSLDVSNALNVAGPTIFDINSSNFSIASARNVLITNSGTSEWNTAELKLSNSLSLANGNIGYFSNTTSSLGSPTSQLSSFSVFASQTTLSDNVEIGGNLNSVKDIISSGSDFVLGNRFSISNQGLITIGDNSLYNVDGYHDQLHVYCKDIYLGNYGTEAIGNVSVGGNLHVAGDIILGNSTSQDLITISGYSININVGDRLDIGGGFRNNIYNPLNPNQDHGGISIDNKGNVALDGKLTVKGPIDPISIIINPLAVDGYDAIVVTPPSSQSTFKVTSDGKISGNKSLSIGNSLIAHIDSTISSFGSLSTVLDDFEIYSNNTFISSNATINGSLTVTKDIFAQDGTFDQDVVVNQNLIVAKNITSTGTNYQFGSAPTISTDFNIKANTITLGVDGYQIGNVTVGNNLFVRNDFTAGISGTYDNQIFLNAARVNVDVGSNIVGALEQGGFRVGGGFQNNAFDSGVVDHGGVTIDSYGNIFADGSILAKGEFGFETIRLTVSPGRNPLDPVLSIYDESDGYTSDLNLTLDGYGNVKSTGCGIFDGCIQLTNLNPTVVEDGTGLGSPLGISKSVFQINHADLEILYGEYLYGEVTYGHYLTRSLDIDDLGNLITNGYIVTKKPGRSNLSTSRVTVGDGVDTFGDYNTDGYYSSFSDPIQQAVDYLSSKGLSGEIFIKAGGYNLTSDIILPENVTVVGEGESTEIVGGGFILQSGSKVKNLKISSATTGITIQSTTKRALISEVFITQCNTGIQIDGDENIVVNSFVTDNSIDGIVITGSNNVVSSNVVLRNP